MSLEWGKDGQVPACGQQGPKFGSLVSDVRLELLAFL